MTAEEIMTVIARGELRSYQAASPDLVSDFRPSSATSRGRVPGLMRVRQFLMKDSYSFDLDAAGWTPPTRSTTRPIAGSSAGADSSSGRWKRTRGRWAAASRTNSW